MGLGGHSARQIDQVEIDVVKSDTLNKRKRQTTGALVPHENFDNMFVTIRTRDGLC
jgi:hypothetical protein